MLKLLKCPGYTIVVTYHTFVMLLPYRVKVSDTKVTHFTPILALCTCSITFTETSIDETNETQQKVRLKIYVHNVHHSREHMHSNDYAAAQSLMVSVAVSSLGDTPPHHLTAQQHTCKPPLVKAKAALRKQKKE